MAAKVMRREETCVFLGDLVKLNLGTKEVEGFVKKQEHLRRMKDGVCESEGSMDSMWERERGLVNKAMENKLASSLEKVVKVKQEYLAMKNRLWWRMRREEDRARFRNRTKEVVESERRLIIKDHKRQIRNIRIETKKKWRMNLPKELERYRDAKIFSQDASKVFKPGDIVGPVTVGLEENLLDSDEIAVLVRGPKFCCRRVLCKERYLIEMEKCYCKIRWSQRDKDGDDNNMEESAEERIERERVEKIAEEQAIKDLLVFDEDDMEIDYRKRRATSCKHNTHVILPGPLTASEEQEIEARRVIWSKIFDDFLAEFTDEAGVQESNLTKAEARGLKKLKKRVADGTLVVVKTDKSGRFSVMSTEEYERAGRIHTEKDLEVDTNFLQENQRRINGYLSMLIKIFRIGDADSHYDRIRSLKLTWSLSVALLYLLSKDH